MADNSEHKQVDDTQWTQVTRRKQGKRAVSHIFVGNIPTKASTSDIWNAVKGQEFFTDLHTPNRRDRNNNRFGFLTLKAGVLPEEVLANINNTKLFGRTLGFDIARRGPPPNGSGQRVTNTKGTKDLPATKLGSERRAFNRKAEVNISTKLDHKISGKENLKMQEQLALSMIGMSHYPDSLHNIREKLWVAGISFISVKATTKSKFLLLFSDKEAFDNFEPDMIHPIFHSVKYTDSSDLITMRTSRLHILGMPIFA